ncbi:hypothetical protein NDN08_002305 [Rhodosorus marinus]|uniref:Ion transport domain-containing protein n=1 Tax=Rhodosorus marinus TaxID=101924 RepID=A0AAV8UTB5_9RHOD|nr:hypothetical protein NDN08_002305 [Rhodosorus marinus]
MEEAVDYQAAAEKAVRLEEPLEADQMDDCESGSGAEFFSKVSSRLSFRRLHLSQRDEVYSVMSFPSYSKTAKAYSIFMSVCVVISIVQLILLSYPTIETDPTWSLVLFIIDCIVSSVFTIDYFLRFAFCRDRIAFALDVFNIVDFFSFLPFYIELGLMSGSGLSTLRVLRVLRLLRLFRIFKISRNVSMIQMLFTALRDAWVSVALLCFVLLMFGLVAGSVMYFIETAFCYYDESTDTWIYNSFISADDEETSFQNIMISMYWAFVTVTTVGYGDTFPITFVGRLVGALVLVLALIAIALPITLVGSTFTRHYEKMKQESRGKGIGFSTFKGSGSRRLADAKTLQSEAFSWDHIIQSSDDTSGMRTVLNSSLTALKTGDQILASFQNHVADSQRMTSSLLDLIAPGSDDE